MIVCKGDGRRASELCVERSIAARTGEVDLPRLGIVLVCEDEGGTRHLGTDVRLGFRDGSAFRERTLIEERLSGTSCIGRLMALVARLPKPINEAFWLTCALAGLALLDEELSSRCRTGVLGSSFMPSTDAECSCVLLAALEESDTSLMSDR
jgi:hypothetical protein